MSKTEAGITRERTPLIILARVVPRNYVVLEVTICVNNIDAILYPSSMIFIVNTQRGTPENGAIEPIQ